MMHMSLLLTLPHATDALSGYSLIAIFSSTTLSAKSSLPRAIAPTKTAILCVSGNVGRYFDSFTVGASPESAADHNPVSMLKRNVQGRRTY